MNFKGKRAAVAVLTALSGTFVSAQVYLCKGAEGKSQYQDAPCAIGAETPTVWMEQRKVEANRRRQDAQKTDALMNAIKNGPANLANCKQEEDCDFSMVRNFALSITREDLSTSLGAPANVQSIGRSEYWYYNFTVVEAGAKRRVRLQFELGAGFNTARQTNATVVNAVNIY